MQQEEENKDSGSGFDWYAQTYIRFEIVKQLQNKYMSYMFYDADEKKYMLRRYFFGYSLKMLDAGFEKINGLYDKRFYADLAYWKPMLAFTWEVERRKQQKEEWDSLKHSRFAGFDFALDFDADGFEHWQSAYRECKKVMGYFDGFGVPYSVRWSGSKGFHVVVRNGYFIGLKPRTKVKRYLEFAKFLRAKFRLKTLDLQIYDMDRVLKLPYTIDCKTGLVVLPLDDIQFNNFYPSMCYPENVIKHVLIKNRGLVERQGSAKNVRKMLKEVF